MPRTAHSLSENATRPFQAGWAVLQRKCACGGQATAGGECEECRKKKKGVLQRRGAAGIEAGADEAVASVLSSPGEPLDPATRTFLEHGFAGARPRVAPAAVLQGKLAVSPATDPAEAEADAFSHRALAGQTRRAQPGALPDFSSVRIHTGSAAERSAASVGALAYTMGRHVVFGAGQFNRHSPEGRRLLAHEAAHVLQQSSRPIIQRQVPPACTKARTDVETHAEYKTIQAAGGTPATEAKDVLDRAEKLGSCVADLTQFKKIFDTKDLSVPATGAASAAARATELKDHRDAGKNSAAAEKTRLAPKTEGAARKGEEEAVTGAVPKANWKTVKAKRGEEFQIDNSDFKNIAVQVKVKLKNAPPADAPALPVGAATDAANIKSLEDGVEKAASTLGYSLDLTFVNTPGKDVLESDVNIGGWTVSSNWVGTNPAEDVPKTLAHELHHRLGLRDRYDYFTHAGTETLSRAARIHWFHFQMVDGGLDPLDKTSLMGSGSVLHEDDICRVALGLMGEHRSDDAATLAADPALKTKFDKCIKERAGLPAEKVKPAQDAAELACDGAITKFGTSLSAASGGKPLAPGSTPHEALILKLTGTAVSLGDIASKLTVIKKQTRMAIGVASNRDASCDGNDGRSTGGKAPVLLCPAFFNKGLPEQTNLILRHAAALATGGSPKRADACTAYDCATKSGKDADQWVHFIKCA